MDKIGDFVLHPEHANGAPSRKFKLYIEWLQVIIEFTMYHGSLL